MNRGATHTAAGNARRELPTWPLWFLYAGFPVLWVLGLAGFAAQLVALPMLGAMVSSRRFHAPRGFGLWLLFLLWMLASSVEIGSGSRLLGWGFRASLYLSATVVFLYVYNSSPRTLPMTRLAAITTVFLGFVILGGYLGLVKPYGVLTTPLGHVLPPKLAQNDLIGKLVDPPFAQTQNSQYVKLAPRPAAPFPYTNDWGVNFALLVPFVMAWIVSATKIRVRVALGVLLVIGAIPALLTLNRGMLLGLSVGVVYVAFRFAMRGHFTGVIAVGFVAVLGLGLVFALHINQRISGRTSASQTNQTRTSTYAETWDQTLQSPFFGHGAPRPSPTDVNAPSLGTQGSFWTVLYSTGFPGLFLFLGGLGGLAWRTRRARSPAMMWMHTAPIMALAMLPFYRMEASELTLVMAASAIAMRDRVRVIRPRPQDVRAVRAAQLAATKPAPLPVSA